MFLPSSIRGRIDAARSGPPGVAAPLVIAAGLLAPLLLPSPSAAWYDTAWGYRRTITIDPTRVPADLVDFPVLINHTDPSFRTVGAGGRVEDASGFDIVFVDGTDAIRLDHEIERYDGSTGEIVMWVRLPSVSSSVGTDLFVYYGNPAIGVSQESLAGLWGNGYEAVWHLDGTFLDSGPNGRNGTNGGSLDTAGQVANGRDFTPVSDVRFGSWNVSGSEITVQGWARFDDFDQDDPRILSKAATGEPQDHVFMLSLGGTANKFPRMRIKTGTVDSVGTTTLIAAAGSLAVDEWYHLAGTYDGAQMTLFENGTAVDSTAKSGTLRQNVWEVWGGNNPNATDPAWASLDGKLDELRVSSVARSPDWLKAEYYNASSPSTFYSVGAEAAALKLVKRAFLPGGPALPSGATVPNGTTIQYLIYVNNPGAARSDLALRDVLDSTFVYRAGTLRLHAAIPGCASDTCTSAEEATIFGSVSGRPVSTDAVDGDEVSYEAGTATIHAGDETAANAPLDVPGGSVAALLFDVDVR